MFEQLIFFCLIVGLIIPTSKSTDTYTLKKSEFTINITELSLFPHQVRYSNHSAMITNGTYNNISMVLDYLEYDNSTQQGVLMDNVLDYKFKSHAKVNIKGNGIPYYEPFLGGHFKVMVVVDTDSPISNYTTNTSIAGETGCIMIGDRRENINHAIEHIMLTPYMNSTFVNMSSLQVERVQLSTLFSVNTTINGDSHRRSNFTTEYTFEFLSTGENPYHPSIEVRNIHDFQIITEGCTRIRGSADFNDVSRWDVVDSSNNPKMSTRLFGHILEGGSQINITQVLQGTIELNSAIYGIGIYPHTIITSLVSGTIGGVGVYEISKNAIYQYIEVETGILQNVFMTGYYPDFKQDGTDNVIFPPDVSTVLRVENDVKLSSLDMSDGTLIAADSQCPKGWTISPLSTGKSFKCFKLYENITDYDSASESCRATGYGSIGARLALINNYDELKVVQGMCRGDDNSNAYKYGCWIGMYDFIGNGTYRWEQHEKFSQISTDFGRSSYSLSFYDWKRSSRTNISVAITGENIEEAKRCVHIAPWQTDPLIQEQGSFMDVGCFLPKASVCQVSASTERYTLTAATAIFDGPSELDGGHLIATSSATINRLRSIRSGKITIAQGTSSNSIQTLVLEDSSSLIADESFEFTITSMDSNISSLIGQGDSTLHRGGGGQPTIYIASGKIVNIPDSSVLPNSTMIIDAKLDLHGTINVGHNIHLFVKQGGDLSSGTLNVESSSTVELDGYACRLSAYDAFDLRLSHRSAFLGEYTRNGSTEAPVSGGYGTGAPIRYGVYRLGVAVSDRNTAEETACIPYNATAEEVAEKLNGIDAISQRGNVTVRRTGSSYDPLDGFGYLYRIELDATPTHYFQFDRVEIYIAGYGHHVNCMETTVSLLDPTGMRTCALEGKSSNIRAKSCVIPPDISMTRLSELSYTKSEGSTGQLIVASGNHRMPQISTLCIGSKGGRAIASADRLDWRVVNISESGSLTITGKGWGSWDATRLLYAPEDTEGREWEGLAYVNGVFMTISNHMYMSGSSNFLVSSPNSIILVQGPENYWSGGIMRGIGHMMINQSLSVDGSFKSLQDLFTLTIEAGATMNVTSGNISMSNGAVINVEGSMIFRRNDTELNRVYIGQSNIFGINISALDKNDTLRDLLKIYPARNWAGYYDRSIPIEEAGGWYPNPECKGQRCLEQPTINIIGNGTVIVEDYANVTFIAPVNFQDQSTLVILTYAYTEFMSGGACGGSVVLNIGQNSRYELTGGNFLMSKTCQIQGDGELTSIAGEHTLASLIQAHITIKGGTLLWPLQNLEGGTITFDNGLLMSHTGKMRLEPWSTIVQVKGEVEFRDECTVEFPVIGTAAQPFLSDDFPRYLDTSPRGALKALDKMIFKGGTLQGKADFIGEQIMELSEHTNENNYTGVKKIMNLAKLVNRGLAVWYSGDIIMENTADMLNEGKFLLNDANNFVANNFYAGIILAKEQGGDMFAENYNSYDLDQGALDYSDYVGKRAESVTVPPSATFIDDLACTDYLKFCSSEQMCAQFEKKCNASSSSGG